MEKYGFVYIWYDIKHKKFYIGCHWGTEDDGYICSSNWMRDAFRRRPQDFKRRIIATVYDRKDLLQEEHKWLSKIKPEELGKKYYNLRNHHFKHWLNESSSKKLIEKISINTKNAMQKPEIREKYLKGLKTRNPTSNPALTKQKRSLSMTLNWEIRSPKNSRKQKNIRTASELKMLHSENSKLMWENRTSKQKNEISEKISKSLKGKVFSEQRKNNLKINHRTKRGYSAWNKGKSLSKEHKNNLKGKRKPWSEERKREHKENMKKWWKEKNLLGKQVNV